MPNDGFRGFPPTAAAVTVSYVGLLVGNGSAVSAGRTLTGTANRITVSNGDGVSGNPTLTVPDAAILNIDEITGTTEITVNESGADLDFRIEGDNSPSLFKTDAGLDAVEITPTTTRASAAGATLNSVNVKAATITVTGTTTTGILNLVTINAPTITDSSAVTITNAATVHISGPPAAAGSVTITYPMALFVESGQVYCGGSLQVVGTTALGTLTLSNALASLYGGTTSTVGLPTICDGRLTLTTGVPVTTSDVTGAGTIYFTPYIGSQVALYDGSVWALHTFTERSLALTLTSGKNYDVFLYDNSGTLTLELSAAWTNDSTRADALTTQNGVYVKSGATTRRYLGTIRASGSNTTEDSQANRLCVNWMNAVPRPLYICPGYSDGNTNTTYATTSTSWTEANGGTGSRAGFLIPLPGWSSKAMVQWYIAAGASSQGLGGLALDSITQSKTCSVTASGAAGAFAAAWAEPLAAGYHYWAMLICRVGANNATIYADFARQGGEAADPRVSSVTGEIMG